MLRPGQSLRQSFTCVDSTGAVTNPTGTPTGTLFRNGVSTAEAVTVAMAGAQGEAVAVIPPGWAQGDGVCIEVSAVIAGSTDPRRGPVVYLSPLTVPAVAGSEMSLVTAYDSAKSAAAPGAAMALTPGERISVAGVIEAEFLNDLTGGTFLAGIQSQIQAILDSNTDVPVVAIAAAVATAVRANMAVELARIDAAISSRLATAGYTAPPSVAGLATSAEVDALSSEIADVPTVAEIAGALLVNANQKLLTNSSGHVTATNGGGGGSGSGVSLVFPLVAQSPVRQAGGFIELYEREQIETSIAVTTWRGAPVDCEGVTATLIVETQGRMRVDEIENLSPVADVVDGVPYRFPFTVSVDMTLEVGAYLFSLRDDADQRVIVEGQLIVKPAPYSA